MWSRWWSWKRQWKAGMRVKEGRSQSRPAMGEGRWTGEPLPGILRPGVVPSTYPPGPGPWDEWNSKRDGPPCGRWSGNWDRWGHRPSLHSGGRLEARNNGRNRAERERCGMTEVAVVRLGQLEGGVSQEHLVSWWMVSSIIRPKCPLPARPLRWGGGGVLVVTSDSQASEWAVVWCLEDSSEGAVVRRGGDWGEGVGGRWHRTAGSRVLGAPSGGRPQSPPWCGTPRPFDGIRSRPSGLCSGSPQVCPDGRILGRTRWGQHSSGWGARWPYTWPPGFRSRSPSSTQLGTQLCRPSSYRMVLLLVLYSRV